MFSGNAWFLDNFTLQQDKMKVPFDKELKKLLLPKLALLKSLCERALMDYVVVTSSTRKIIRDFTGNFFHGHSYRRVRQCYIESFAILLRTLSRLLQSSDFKKNVSPELQLIEGRTAVTLFATSLYCLQDCLVHFDDVKQQNDLPLVQSACIGLLETLTSAPYLNAKWIDEDMVCDLMRMIHHGVKNQVTKRTAHFSWSGALAQLLLNCVDTVLTKDLSLGEDGEITTMNLGKLITIIVSCWVDPIDLLISYITTTYDESPFLRQDLESDVMGNGVKSKSKKKGIEVNLDESMLESLISLVAAIHKYNVQKADEQEIDCKNWALPLSDWAKLVTMTSMLMSTAYKVWCQWIF